MDSNVNFAALRLSSLMAALHKGKQAVFYRLSFFKKKLAK